MAAGAEGGKTGSGTRAGATRQKGSRASWRHLTDATGSKGARERASYRAEKALPLRRKRPPAWLHSHGTERAPFHLPLHPA